MGSNRLVSGRGGSVLIDAMMETLMMVMNTSIMLKDLQETICVVILGVAKELWLLGGKQQAGFPVAEAVMLIDAMMETLMMVMNTSIMLKDLQETICVVILGVADEN